MGSGVRWVILAAVALSMTGSVVAQTPSPSAAAGMALMPLDAATLDYIQAEVGYRGGVVVNEVKAGSPAATCGLVDGDVLLRVGGVAVASPDAVDQALGSAMGTVTVTVLREGDDDIQQQTLQLALSGASGAQQTVQTAEPSPSTAGLVLKALPEETLDNIEQSTGVRVGVLVESVEAGSAAFAAGVHPGDLVLGVGDSRTASPADVKNALAGRTGKVGILVLRRGAEDKWETMAFELAPPEATKAIGPETLGAILTPQPPPTVDAEDVRAKLAALQAAHDAGILTQAEYAAKKAELDGQLAASAGPPDPEVNKKLAALEAARIAGVLSDAEYAAKRAELLGSAGAPAPQVKAGTTSDPVDAYFSLMDFVRSEAWGRGFNTPVQERQRVAALLQKALPSFDQQSQAAVQQIPQQWASVQKMWAGFSDENKTQQRQYWRKQLLLPTQFFPPPPDVRSFQSEAKNLSFQYPSNWILAQTRDDATRYMFVTPQGTESTWETVADPANSPGGAFFSVAPIDEELRGIGTYVEGARILASRYVTGEAPQMKEIFQFDDKQEGGLVAFSGKLQGQTEERFYWVGLVRFGPDFLIAIRFGGPVAQADRLVPAFYHILSTLEIIPPDGGGAGYTGFCLGAEMVRNTTMSAGWYAQNHGG